jgi:hypothetical protein
LTNGAEKHKDQVDVGATTASGRCLPAAGSQNQQRKSMVTLNAGDAALTTSIVDERGGKE